MNKAAVKNIVGGAGEKDSAVYPEKDVTLFYKVRAKYVNGSHIPLAVVCLKYSACSKTWTRGMSVGSPCDRFDMSVGRKLASERADLGKPTFTRIIVSDRFEERVRLIENITGLTLVTPLLNPLNTGWSNCKISWGPMSFEYLTVTEKNLVKNHVNHQGI